METESIQGDPMLASDGALAGMRILDFTQVMAGPFCTMLLADLGADVIKIESPGSGDQTRHAWGHTVQGQDTYGFMALNRNKRSVCIDLKSAEGRARLYDLVRTADVVIENWRPGVATRLGLDYDTLAAINPAVVCASISGFGQTGPYAGRPGYDLIAQAMAGVMSVTGEPGGRPVKCGLPISDLAAGLYCACGILAALTARRRTGKGQYVETSLFEAALALSVWESTEYWSTGNVPRPLGSAHRMTAPYQALRTRDGYVTVGANNQQLWLGLCAALGMEELASDARFASNVERMRNRDQLASVLESRLAERDTADWVEILLRAGVPAGPIQDYRQVLEEDPHVRSRGLVQRVDHPVAGSVRMLASPLRLSADPPSIRRPPPRLGEHTAEVLGEVPGEVPAEGAGGDPAPSPAAGDPPDGDIVVRRDGDGEVLWVGLSNPRKRNAITWSMYERLERLCAEADADRRLRLLVVRGEGGAAFAAGTDIQQFTRFATAEDGVAYERRMERALERLAGVRVPVLAVVEGAAVGAGLAIAACCDIVVATPDAVFGAPIARTLGNCLSPRVVARLQSRLGAGHTMSMLLTSKLLSAQEAAVAGLVHAVVPREQLEEHVAALVATIAGSAPLTLAGLKEIDRRLHAPAAEVDADDVLRSCYGSSDFAEGVRAFLEHRRPRWQGR
jgi:crotonobetainyl-CoA:carnitine CoA-transferase CaiB-like acyl-CoA transferase/enoyl-CoA hydratase/carnithine racemase